MKKLLTVIGIGIITLGTGCAFNKVESSSTQGTNITTIKVRTYAFWPATSTLDKQKISAGKTLSVGTEGLVQEGGGTNIANTISALTDLIKALPK